MYFERIGNLILAPNRKGHITFGRRTGARIGQILNGMYQQKKKQELKNNLKHFHNCKFTLTNCSL